MLFDRDSPKKLNDRRSFIKLAAAAPLFATIGSRSFASTVAAVAANKTRTEEVYTSLGVRHANNLHELAFQGMSMG